MYEFRKCADYILFWSLPLFRPLYISFLVLFDIHFTTNIAREIFVSSLHVVAGRLLSASRSSLTCFTYLRA